MWENLHPCHCWRGCTILHSTQFSREGYCSDPILQTCCHSFYSMQVSQVTWKRGSPQEAPHRIRTSLCVPLPNLLYKPSHRSQSPPTHVRQSFFIQRWMSLEMYYNALGQKKNDFIPDLWPQTSGLLSTVRHDAFLNRTLYSPTRALCDFLNILVDETPPPPYFHFRKVALNWFI